MTALRLDDLRQHTDILRLRNGKALAVRFVEPDDAEALQGYFRSLSVGSRYNRFLGAMSELPQTELAHFIHVGESDRFSVIAVMVIDGVETIVGEAATGSRLTRQVSSLAYRSTTGGKAWASDRPCCGIWNAGRLRSALAACSAIHCDPTMS